MTFPDDVKRVTGEHELFFIEEREGQRTTVLFYGRKAFERLTRFLCRWTR